MNTNEVTEKKCNMEIIKWSIVGALLFVTIIGNYFYKNIDFLLRVLFISFIMIIVIAIIITTSKCKLFIQFVREARIEISKIIWPTKQETLHTTLIVLIATIFMSLILWGLDNILYYLISFFINLRL